MILVIIFILFNFLHALNEVFQGRRPSNDTSSGESYNNSNPRTRSRDFDRAVESSEPQNRRREWLSSGDEEEPYSYPGSSTKATAAEEDDFISFVNDLVPQTLNFHMLVGESNSQGDHPPTAYRSVSTPISRTPYRGYDFDDLKILFFKLDPANTNSQADTEPSELRPSLPGEPIDLDRGTMLITSLKDTNNNSREVEFRMSPLRGKYDAVLVYTTEGVLAARIPNTQLKESRAFIDDTITKLHNTAETSVPSPKTISWLRTSCEVVSQIPPMQVCFIITNNDGAVIRGSRIPNGIPRNTYTSVFGEILFRTFCL